MPNSITFITNPIQVSDLTTVNFTWSNGILTKMVEKSGTSTLERTFTRDKDGLITKIDINANGDKYSRIYRYSVDKKTIYDGDSSYVWRYNDKKQLIKRTTIGSVYIKPSDLILTWDPDINLVSTMTDAKYQCTVTGWSGSTNPLWEITKQTQFLLISDFNYPTVILYLSEKVSNPWEFKSLTSTAKNTVINTTKEDAQKRIININTIQSGLLAQDMKIVY